MAGTVTGLNSRGLFLWGYVKNEVFKECFETEEQLLQSVLAALNTITPQMLSRVLDATVRRAYLCLENEGNLFEHLL